MSKPKSRKRRKRKPAPGPKIPTLREAFALVRADVQLMTEAIWSMKVTVNDLRDLQADRDRWRANAASAYKALSDLRAQRPGIGDPSTREAIRLREEGSIKITWDEDPFSHAK